MHEIHEIFTAASFANRETGEGLDSGLSKHSEKGSFVFSEDSLYQSETVVVWTFTNAPGQNDDFLLFSSYVLCFYETVFFLCFCCFPLRTRHQKPFLSLIPLTSPASVPLKTSHLQKTSDSVCFLWFLCFFSPFYFIFIVSFVISYFMIHLTAKQKQQSIWKASLLKLVILSQVCLYLFLAEKEK